jgi:hypothetical protein
VQTLTLGAPVLLEVCGRRLGMSETQILF